MSSIRRILSGISSSAAWAARFEALAPIRQAPPAPVEPVRRGFSDHSDFQSAQEAERSPLGAHAPNLSGRQPRNADMLRSYTGLSDFQAALPRYQHLLGTNVPPPPGRAWEPPRARAPQAEAPPPADSAPRPGLAATADLEKAFELAGDEDTVLLYAHEGAGTGRSVVQHEDGSLTDPADPKNRFADAAAWEAANPGLTRAASLSRNDAELVLAMPEGPAREEVLAELTSGFTPASTSAAPGDAFMPSLEDLPVDADPAEAVADADAFMPSLEDVPGGEGPVEELLAATAEAVPLSPEELEGALAGGMEPMDLATQVARRGTPEMQARVATTLSERSPRAAALAASASPEATQALLQQLGEPRLADFVRSVMLG